MTRTPDPRDAALHHLTEQLLGCGFVDPVVRPAEHGTYLVKTRTMTVEVAAPFEDTDRVRWARLTANDILTRLRH